MKKQFKKITAGCLVAATLLSSAGVFAMDSDSTSLSTAEFDSGMAKGIWYFNKGMYYEAKDEFQWFCDYNWGRMNAGQQKYALDYLGSAKQKIQQWENSQKNTSYFPIPGTKLNFTLVNHSGNDISEIYISEITHDTWEENILNENLLSYDSSRISFTGTFDTSRFDLLFICVDGEEIVFKDIDLSVVNTATLTYNGYDGYNLNW